MKERTKLWLSGSLGIAVIISLMATLIIRERDVKRTYNATPHLLNAHHIDLTDSQFIEIGWKHDDAGYITDVKYVEFNESTLLMCMDVNYSGIFVQLDSIIYWSIVI